MERLMKAVIEVCGSCNYACQMCPQSPEMGGRERAFKKNLPLATFKNILDELAEEHDVEEIYLEGSGEPTMNKKLLDYIAYGAEKGFKMSFITNGTGFTGQQMRDIIDAGMHYARVSVIGSTPELYAEWMPNANGSKEDTLEDIINNCNETLEYIKQTGSNASLGSYHLITNDLLQALQVQQYQNNFINRVPGIRANIWRMHNWAGQYDNNGWREGHQKRSCGRPFSPDIVIRAGGNDGKHGAVVPCCMVLGRDSEAVMGHLSENTIEEIYDGETYNHLRKMHEEHRFDEIDYCKNCDMLYDAPEALVWSTGDSDYNSLTGGIFDMRKYRK